ncbi:polyamine-modulated factor 1-binding protein 1 [Grus japonensis]|uniref:Polyamine-modulated factor 1-binding protein 1 n=1 Tax=Grus japonensis TaxID=30415 RepID=A0ABC9XCD5_GRUJA
MPPSFLLQANRFVGLCGDEGKLDAQEQRIYQLQTKQRERQAELEQIRSRIQQLSQDLEASHQLQEEAQKQESTALCLPPAECGHGTSAAGEVGWNVNESFVSSVGLEGRLRATSTTIKTTGVTAEPTLILLMAGKAPQRTELGSVLAETPLVQCRFTDLLYIQDPPVLHLGWEVEEIVETKQGREGEQRWEAKDKVEAKKEREAEQGWEAEEKVEAEQRWQIKKGWEAKEKVEAKQGWEAEEKVEAEKEWEDKHGLEAEEKVHAKQGWEAKEKVEAEKEREDE